MSMEYKKKHMQSGAWLLLREPIVLPYLGSEIVWVTLILIQLF